MFLNVDTELRAMADRMFSADMIDAVADDYQKVLQDDGMPDDIGHSEECREMLKNLLQPDQLKLLEEMEQAASANVRYALEFAFTRGLFAFFEQEFHSSSAPSDPYDTYVNRRIMMWPGMESEPEYFRRRQIFNDRYNRLEEQLGEAAIAAVIVVYDAWEAKLFGIVHYGFYLGYRYGYAAADKARGIPLSLDSAHRLLNLEYELGITETQLEREKRQIWRERKNNG